MSENKPMPKHLWVVVECVVEGCGDGTPWGVTFTGSNVPQIPHAVHLMETGHDYIATFQLGERKFYPNEISAEDLRIAELFSAGWEYGSEGTRKAVTKRILSALMPEDL